jgi:hypothetical protein
MPGGEKLTPDEAMAGAQYALSIGANPLNGEVYIFKDWKGKLITVEGYKLLERWARRQCNYMSRETTPPDNELSEGDIAVRMWILRDDMRPALRDLVDMGAPWGEAFETVATYADGVIGKDERFTRDGKAIAPPKGWTWHQKARVRALKNAIRQAYGMPSLAEIAAMSWESDGVQTEPDDWRGAEQYDRRGAEALARERAIRREAEPLTAEDKAAGAAALFGQVLEAETVEPEPEAPVEPQEFTTRDGRPYTALSLDELTTIKDGLERGVASHNANTPRDARERLAAIGALIMERCIEEDGDNDDAAGRAAVDEMQAEADAVAETLTPPMF